MRPVLLALLTLLAACDNIGSIGGPLDIDEDEDGASLETDCDDRDPHVFPGNPERCDNLDNDCSGGIDDKEVCARELEVDQTLRLDLLLVVDDSVTMLPHQTAVSTSMAGLLGPLLIPGADVHLGVITTDFVSADRQGRLVPYAGRPFIAAEEGPAFGQDWAQNAVLVGTDGAGEERGLDALFEALTVHSVGVDAGFRRPDAHLTVVVLGDEDDQSTLDVQDFVNARPSFAPSLTVHSIVPTSAGCPQHVAQRYLALAALTGGATLSICAADYGQFLDAIGQSTAQEGLGRVFPLDSPAQAGSVVVDVSYPGGLLLPLPPDSFGLSNDASAVVIFGDPPPAGSTLHIQYDEVPVPPGAN